MNTVLVLSILRWSATVFFLVAGALHFVIPDFYRAMMPPFIPFQEFFIILTGIAEMAGAVGIQIPRFRLLAGRMMILLMVSIFPANIYVAVAQPMIPGLEYTPESMWWRLLLQPLFIVWIWVTSVRSAAQETKG